MVVVMEERATEAEIQSVIAQLIRMGFDVHRSTGSSRTVIGAVGNGSGDPQLLEVQQGVHEVLRITEPYKLASRTFKPENTVITVGDVRIGGDEVIVMAGPCSAESEEQVEATAAAVRKAGAKVLRGGAFKPRSSPYSFQGLGEEGLRMLRSAADRHGLKLVTEIMESSQIEMIERYGDILDSASRSDTYPYIEVEEQDVQVEHEASVSRIGEEQLFYLQSRGLTEAEASSMIVSGFIEPLVKELPMEYAVEMNRLIELQMEGSVG